LPLLRTSARGLADLSKAGRLSAVLAEQMSFQMKRRASAAEMRSWDSSLRVLAEDLTHAGLDQVEVLLEYQLPLSSKRIDVVLAGRHPRRDAPSYVVVELKQWTEATLFEDDAELVVQPTYGPRPILSPVAQVRAYGEYLLDFTTALHGTTDVLTGAAYLHNASTRGWASCSTTPKTNWVAYSPARTAVSGWTSSAAASRRPMGASTRTAYSARPSRQASS
jgi:uncharacterized protein